ncbi:NAD-dependent epimerase/dehydratase family protein [Candidatus Thioglobus sp.]|nr:NAD-dependent epimerase/dehydratase family protein [Candidatus Thioglobus sp.]
MNILVTGGAGFIGSHLCDFLVSKENHVIVLDDLSSGNLSNLENVIETIEFHNAKVEDFNFNKLKDIDAVIHLAAQVSVPTSIQNFGRSSSSNILSSIKVINYCRKNQIPLVYASSSAVYGNLDIGNDQISDIDLLSPYAVDKYAMEIYTKTAHKLYQLSSIGLRFFNVYGPRQDSSSPYSGVISIFIDRLINEQVIKINGGYQTRDFIYIKDVVDSIYRGINLVRKNIICNQINVLTGKSISIDEVASILINEIGNNVDKEYRDLKVGDPKKSEGTTKKMQELLKVNISDMVNIENGISETLNFIYSNR